MEGNQNNQIEKLTGYGKQMYNISDKIQNINDSLNQLKQEVNLIKSEVEEIRVNELLEKMDMVMNKTDENLTNIQTEVYSQKEELSQLEDHMKQNTPNKPKSRKPSEYRQLQNMLRSVNNVGQTSNQINSSMSNRSTFNQTTSINQKSRRTGQNTIPTSKGKKMFRGSQYDLNKNTITRISTSKK
ncbi:hypothetical protein [Gracilibacillus sp. YIM 98692]|uniref:hypothetical protein n=1 Tax=Gracilibacillus sp. YIM 98692 TaxID=2663532 RepID=UPI0013D2F056|nr:hypothetical protein [Gracilibacillus sp. YIM 98692]